MPTKPDSHERSPDASATGEPFSSALLDALGRIYKKALQPDLLPQKVKALIALATSVGTGCETSIAYHLHNALEAGAAPEEIVEAVEVVLVTLGEPASLHALQIVRALDPEGSERLFEASTRSRLHAQGMRVVAHPYMAPD